MLPLDLFWFLVKRQISFMTALAIQLRSHVASDATVENALDADRIPISHKVVLELNNLYMGSYVWPVHRELYKRRNITGTTTFSAPVTAKIAVGERMMASLNRFPLDVKE